MGGLLTRSDREDSGSSEVLSIGNETGITAVSLPDQRWQYVVAVQDNESHLYIEHHSSLTITRSFQCEEMASTSAETESETCFQNRNVFVFRMSGDPSVSPELKNQWPYLKFRNGVEIIDGDTDINMRPAEVSYKP
jgi:hypothetical protein